MNRTVKYIFLLIFFLTSNLYAEKDYLNIDAKKFESNEKKNFIHFKGDVIMSKNNDTLKCQDLMISTKKNSKKQIPKKYKAKGNVTFTITLKDKILKGGGDTVFYYPDEQKYIITGNGYLEDTKTDKKLFASKIYIDEKTGLTKIDGEKNKPVKFRLKLGN